ncbi:phosphoglycolate phosphatase [Spirochaetia bacterium]|nr:phosphoglycolate phosphatase [Spirochaetia bacterium]
MKYKNILFDLDGTLTDSYLGISNSVKYALEKFNILEDRPENLARFIGPPLTASFAEFYSFNEADTKKAIAYYQEYFVDKGIFENKLYDDIETVLRTLNDRQYACMVATSKPERFALRILRILKIDRYFAGVVGADEEGGTVSEKDVVIRRLLEKECLVQQETIMVGDRKFDISGAHRNGIDSIAVTYGYGSIDELASCKPTYLCGSPLDILNILQ